MQSGITVSQELHDAFNDLVSSPSQRGVIATIHSESLNPLHTITSTSPDFFQDLASLHSLLSTKEAAYILLRRYPDAPDGYVAVTYVPDSAPVRQKMLFASTRLTLVRDLGTERFRESLFATELSELGKEGWERRDASGALNAPLTQEEETLKGVKDAEAEARAGTDGKKLATATHMSLSISDGARQALESLKSGVGGTLVQLSINVNDEMIELAGTSKTDVGGLASAISATEPRYSLFRYTHHFGDAEEWPLIFVYTCPSELKIKERMLSSLMKQGFLSALSTDNGLEISKKFEVTDPSEITISMINDEFRPQPEQKQGFSRPKRPGKR